VSPRREPTPAEALELSTAATLHFGKCDCHVHPDRRVCTCAAHEWLTADPTRRGLVHTWERLLWMRTQRTRMLEAEGLLPPTVAAAPSPAPNVLPW
jgi:hypothetical protein